MGKIALNNGLIAGLIGVALTLLASVTGFHDMADDFTGESSWNSTIVSAISFAILIYFIIKSMNEYKNYILEGMMGYWDALKVGILTGFISALVSAVFLLIYLGLIEPDLIEQVKETAIYELEEQNLEGQEYETAKSMMTWFMNPIVFALTSLFSGTFLALIISLILAIFQKSK
jgi:hypothetical protein